MTLLTTEISRIKLVPACYDYVMQLFELGADKDWVAVAKDVLPEIFTRLTDEKSPIAQRRNIVRGPHGSRGDVKLLITDRDLFERKEDRKPRSPSEEGRTARIQTVRHSSRLPLTDHTPSGKLLVGQDTVEEIHLRLAEYVAITSPEAQREWYLKQHKSTSPNAIARLANQLEKEGASDEQVAETLHNLLRDRHMTFKQYVEGKFNKLIVELLGIRTDVDTPESKPPVNSSTEEPLTPPSNGKLTEPVIPSTIRVKLPKVK